MTPELRSQFDAAKAVHTPRADFVQSLEARIAAAPVTAPVSEHFPDQVVRVFEQFIASFVPASMVPLASRVAALFLVFGVAVGGWIGAVSASYDTLPGDMLYSVKLATEKVQLVAAEASGDTSRTVQLHTDFTERRATEVQRIVTERPESERTQQAVDRLTRSVQNATVALQKASVTSGEPTTEPNLFLERTEQIARSLQAVLIAIPPDVSYLIDEIVRLQGGLTEQRLTLLQEIIRTQVGDQTSLTPGETRDIVLKALAEISDQSREQVALLEQQMTTERTTEETQSIHIPQVATTTEVVGSSTHATTTGSDAPTDSSSTATPVSPLFEIAISTTTPDESPPLESQEADVDLSSLSASVVQDLEVVETLVSEGKLVEALETAKHMTSRQVQIQTWVRKNGGEGTPEEQTPQDQLTTSSVSAPETANVVDVPVEIAL